MKSILILAFSLALAACVTDEYDLKNGINTDIAFGGDSLSVPIGETDSITLGKLIGDQDISVLTKSSTGAYALNLKSSSVVKLDAIKPVSFAVGAINTPLIKTNSIDVNFPSFSLDEFNISSPVVIPDISISSIGISGISDSYPFEQTPPTITVPPGTPNNTSFSIPINITDNRTIPQNLNFINTNQELDKINNVIFDNDIVTLTLKKILPADVIEDVSKIISFRIDFPTEFTLSLVEPTKPGKIENNSSFVISNYEGTGDFTVSFRINSIDLSNVDQKSGAGLNEMHYNKNIYYSMNYQLQSHILSQNVPNINSNTKIGINVALKAAAPLVKDAQILTKSFAVNLQTANGNSNVNTDVANIPSDISKVNFLTFSGNPTLKLTIDDPFGGKFLFNAGKCDITFPNSFDYTNGSKTLSIPASQLLGSSNIVGISGITLNKPVVPLTHTISISDQLTYQISGLMVAPTTISLNEMQGYKNKSLNIKALCSPFQIENANVNTNSITFPIQDQNTTTNITELVSKDVKKIFSISLKNPSTLTFKIIISKLPKFETINFKNYTIELPGFLKFADSDNLTNNKLVLNEGFNLSTGFSKELHLVGFDWNSVGGNVLNADGTFSQDIAIKMTGSVYVNSTENLDSKSFTSTQIEVQPSITIGDMDLSVISGEIKPKIDQISQSVKVDLPAALKNENNNLDIKNPVIEFEIGNSMGIAIDLPLNLIPISKGVAVPNATISTSLHISETSVMGQTTWSKFRLSAAATGITDDHQIVIIPNLANLLKTIPDSISITAVPAISGNKQTVDLYSPKNQIDLNYNVNVPLEFGSGFKIQINDTIPNLNKSLQDILKFTRNIEIIAQVENQIPMNFGFKVTPCNTAGKVIDGITVSSDSILYNNADPIKFGLKETAAGALDQLDKLILTISASKNYATSLIPLKASQFIKLKLKVLLPKGVTISSTKSAVAKKK